MMAEETHCGPRPVLRLGDPALRTVCAPCDEAPPETLRTAKTSLAATLADFRATHGFGRGIAAPQIGSLYRFIAVDTSHFGGEGIRILSNPVITWRSDDTFTLWDDCMSLPDLLCRVRRHTSVSVQFVTETGEVETWPVCDRPLSELLQHELDHLDGVLITDIAKGTAAAAPAVVSRKEYERSPHKFNTAVDYTI